MVKSFLVRYSLAIAVASLGLAGLLAYALFIRQFHLPSGSMEPSIQPFDRVLVLLTAYDPDSGDPADLPERGDLVVFDHPVLGYSFLKRVIGLPGDRIQYRNGRLVINDQTVQRTYISELAYTDYTGLDKRVKVFSEELPGGISHFIYEQSDRAPMDHTQLYEVPPDHFFMLGNNRDNSADSRVLSNMGYIHKDWLVGKALYKTYGKSRCSKPEDATECPANAPVTEFFSKLR